MRLLAAARAEPYMRQACRRPRSGSASAAVMFAAGGAATQSAHQLLQPRRRNSVEQPVRSKSSCGVDCIHCVTLHGCSDCRRNFSVLPLQKSKENDVFPLSSREKIACGAPWGALRAATGQNRLPGLTPTYPSLPRGSRPPGPPPLQGARAPVP